VYSSKYRDHFKCAKTFLLFPSSLLNDVKYTCALRLFYTIILCKPSEYDLKLHWIDVSITILWYRLKPIILIVVETEPAADIDFERETSLYAKPAKKGGHGGARPKIRKLTLNAADIHSNVDKRKGCYTVDYIVNFI